MTVDRVPQAAGCSGTERDGPFNAVPFLPVVPLPHPGEALGSWLGAIGRLYGLTTKKYLARLGVPVVRSRGNLDVDVLVRPPRQFMHALAADTGVALDWLYGMTFAGLEKELETAVPRHHAPCPACHRRASERMRRPVELLHARSPWRVVCPEHPPPLKWGEISNFVDPALFFGKVKSTIACLDKLAFKDKGNKPPMEAPMATVFSVAEVLRFLYVVNAHLLVRVERYDELKDFVSFVVLRAYERDNRGKPIPLDPKERNSLAVSMILVWQLTVAPYASIIGGLWTERPAARKDASDLALMKALIRLIMEYWPAEMLSALFPKRHSERRPALENKRYTALSLKILEPFQNQTIYQTLLPEADWAHRAWIALLMTPELSERRYRKYSEFEAPRVFRYKGLPADRHGADAVRIVRTAAWRSRAWPRAIGLQRYAEPPRSFRNKSPRTPRSSATAANAPERVKVAVRQALDEVGPVPPGLSPKESRALYRKLRAKAVRRFKESKAAMSEEGRAEDNATQ